MALALFAAMFVVGAGGCASSVVKLRSVPETPLAERLDLSSWGGPKPSQRTMQVLRVHNLADQLDDDRGKLLDELQAITEAAPTPDKVYALAELSFIGGVETEDRDPQLALDLFGASVLHAYRYLFDPQLQAQRNAYDPQYRGACDLYNGALERALRMACKTHGLVPGETATIETSAGTWDITCVLRGDGWRKEDMADFKFASDYEVRGLTNQYRSHGLGVPLIAIRHPYEGEPPHAKYYPQELAFPVTALFRPVAAASAIPGRGPTNFQGVIELYDPLSVDHVEIDGCRVALEADMTTPLAYYLNQPGLGSLATEGLLHPETLMDFDAKGKKPVMGLYMVQPYDPNKIPVVMIHGLWSSPMTWMEMFNDLRSVPEIRDNYQIWFYLYPSGQPFWISATQFRADLAEARRTLDPQGHQPALDQMVLVGHSMGGLVSKLQTIDSGDRFWHLVSDEPFNAIEADPEVRDRLAHAFFFHPNPSIRQVVTIGTPHRGSSFSNQTTQWLMSKLITLPQVLVAYQEKLYRDNKGKFRNNSLLKIHNSVDSLAPDNPIFDAMLSSEKLPGTQYHNIVGVAEGKWWLTAFTGEGDGVVPRTSAHIDNAVSEIVVPADHTTVHTHPKAVLEVRRILLEHLGELRGRRASNVATRNATEAAAAAWK